MPLILTKRAWTDRELGSRFIKAVYRKFVYITEFCKVAGTDLHTLQVILSKVNRGVKLSEGNYSKLYACYNFVLNYKEDNLLPFKVRTELKRLILKNYGSINNFVNCHGLVEKTFLLWFQYDKKNKLVQENDKKFIEVFIKEGYLKRT